MSRLAGGLILLAAIATFGAVCYFDDDGQDRPDPPFLGTPIELALNLQAVLPSDAEVNAAFEPVQGSYQRGVTDFIDDTLTESAVGEQLAAGLMGAIWRAWGTSSDFEAGPGEPLQVVVSIAMYDDAGSAAEAVDLGPEMFTSASFGGCVEPGTFVRDGEANAWSAACAFGEMGATLIQRDQFVLWVVGRYARGADLVNLISEMERLAPDIDLTSIPSD